MRITHSEDVFDALGVQHPMSIRHVVMYFSALSHKRHYLKKIVLNMKCVL
jgi:hypothetical protein